MYEKGDFIIFGLDGVCEVTDITHMNITGNDENKLYYTLRPLNARGSTIFVSTDNTKTKMRKIISKEQALSLIDELPYLTQINASNDKLREEQYKEALKTCDCREWARVIKTSYSRKQERLSQKKRVTAVDERYMKLAEDNLYAELSIPLSLTKDKLEEFIATRIHI